MFLKRIGAFIAAVPLVGLGFLAVTSGAASAGTGTTIATKNAAGYEASGRDFRFATSTVTIPDWFSSVFYPQEYIQLSNGSLNEYGGTTGDQYVRAGIEPCAVAHSLNPSTVCTPGDWVAFAEAFNNSLNAPYWAHYTDLAGAEAGDGVNFSIYFDQAGNELHFTITPPSTSGPEQYYKTNAHGPLFDHAAALDDFLDSTGSPFPLPPGLNPIKINQFLQGALTTYSGTRGSFNGAWTTSKVEATSNGLPYPSGTVRVGPGSLFTDGLEANGAFRASDAFTTTLTG
jgi:hypothetical protein